VFGVYFASETAQVELESERVKAPAVSMEQRGSPALSPVQSSARPVAPSIRGLHPSTSQLNVSVFCELNTFTFQLYVFAFRGLCPEVSSSKAFQVELKSGRLLWLL